MLRPRLNNAAPFMYLRRLIPSSLAILLVGLALKHPSQIHASTLITPAFASFGSALGGTTNDYQWSGFAAETMPSGVSSSTNGMAGQWPQGILSSSNSPSATFSGNTSFPTDYTDFLATSNGGGIYAFFTQTHYQVTNSSPLSGLESLTFQIYSAEGLSGAFGGSAVNLAVAPTLTVTTASGTQTLAATFSSLLGQTSAVVNGSSTFLDDTGYQWDLSSITQPITGYSINWQSSYHGVNYGEDLTESSSVIHNDVLAAPEPSRAMLLLLAFIGVLLRRRRTGRANSSRTPATPSESGASTIAWHLSSETAPRKGALRNRGPLRLQFGFTLIELLVTITIVTVLCGMAYSAYNFAVSYAKMTREISAAKSLISAYASYADDHLGMLMPGYDRTVGEVSLPNGSTVGGPTAERYPYRLAPYFSNEMLGTVLVNNNVTQISANDTYMISCFPALGMNYIFVGGDISSQGTLTFPSDCVTAAPQAKGSLLVFASAGSAQAQTSTGTSAGKVDGYCILTPPQETGVMWSGAAWTSNSAPDQYGNVDARYGGKAVCAFLDGAVRTLSIADLRDMRLWSNNAALANSASYTVTPPAPATTSAGRPAR